LQAGGQVSTLEAQGLDPFLLLVLPRSCALALAAFTLGVAFVVLALLSGFVFGEVLGALTISLWSLFDRVLLAMRAADFIVFPVKMLTIGLLVALTACLTAFEARPREPIAVLLPRGFVRGILAILLASIALGLAV
jgi:phospholipid/cholesterol/gamma-HCH transport system permease protein